MSQTVLNRSDVSMPELVESVALVGLGYVGLPTALSMVSAGRPVIGYDISETRIQNIHDLNVDLLPEDLDRLREHLDNPLLTLTSDKSQLAEVDGIIVCVPTPIRADFSPNLDILKSACADVVAVATQGQTIILTSTTYVGCTRDFLTEALSERGLEPGKDVHIAFSPERIDPGVANHRPEETPRVVGGLTPACVDAAERTLRGSAPSLHRVSSLEASEMCKLLENTYRAVNISMVNEFAAAAKAFGVNISEVIDAAATKPFGFQKFTPGPGVGGHCIPCDPHYLLWTLRSERMSAPVVEAAMRGIAERPLVIVRAIEEQLLRGGIGATSATVHIHGVAYKPDVADFRESPAEVIIAELIKRGIGVEFSDPLIPTVDIAGQRLSASALDETKADVILVHTLHAGLDIDWSSFTGRIVDATYKLTPGGNVVQA